MQGSPSAMPLALESCTSAAVFLIVLLVGFVGNFVATRALTRGLKKGKPNPADRWTSLIVNVANGASFLLSVALAYLGVALLPDWLFYAGLVVFLLGIGLATWAALVLGSFYSQVVQIQPGHQIVEEGPYAVIRHPIYLGAIVAFLGIAMTFQSVAAVFAALVMNGLGYGYRITVEERFLLKELGAQYLDYCTRTKRLIPFLF